MSQETVFRDAVDAMRANGSRYAREAYVFIVAALGETVRSLPDERRSDAAARHLSGQELTAGVIGIARDEFGPLAPTVFSEWGVRATDDIGAIVFELVDAGQLSARAEDTIMDFATGIDLMSALAERASTRPRRVHDD